MIRYWRHPTQYEIKFGEGAIHWIDVDKSEVTKPDGEYKKWFYKDGLRYNRP